MSSVGTQYKHDFNKLHDAFSAINHLNFLLRPNHFQAHYDEVKPQSLEVVLNVIVNVISAPTSAESELGIILHS